MYLICMKGYYNMDLTSPRTIRNIQEQFGFTFKKGLGQWTPQRLKAVL